MRRGPRFYTMQAAWPTTTTVTSYLAGLGITVPSGLTLATVLGAAIQDWEFAVGISPWFISSTTTATSYTVSPFGEGALHIPPCADVDAVILGETTLTADQDYYLKPSLALANFRPITYIEFESRITGFASSVEIQGKWGYQTQIFDDVWQLVLDLTVGKVLEAAQMKAVLAQSVAASGPITEVRQENITIKYDSTAGRSFLASLETRKTDLANKYRLRGF